MRKPPGTTPGASLAGPTKAQPQHVHPSGTAPETLPKAGEFRNFMSVERDRLMRGHYGIDPRGQIEVRSRQLVARVVRSDRKPQMVEPQINVRVVANTPF